jgi:isoquinoline 1-oxidoreductase
MSEHLPGPDIEVERYELSEAARYRFELERRDFLRVLTAMGGGLLVVASRPGSAQNGESGRGGRGGAQASGDLTSWLHIDEQGRVTAFTGKVEIGQNIRTSLTQTVSDELRVPPSAVTMVMADTDLTPFDQGTFGSRTTPMMAPLLARAAATARGLLLARAAETWNVSRETLTARDGRISTPDGRSIGYGELIKAGPLTGAVAARPDEMARDQWAVRGTSLKKIDGRDFVTGRHDYTADLKREGLLIGRVVRPTAIGAVPTSVAVGAARAMPGVTVVRDGDFIGVTAPDERKAAAAAAAVKVEWRLPAGLPTSESIYEHLKRTAGAASIPAATSRNEGRVFRASYRIPYIAHVPPEPRSAVAEWTGDKLTVWAATQRPFGVRSELAQAFRIPDGRVRVIVPDMGSGYGGKHTGDVAVEAARLAKAAGRPVKIVYTRAEEFMWAYFRPAGVIDIDARVDAMGRLSSWEFHNYNSGGSGLRTPYAVPDRREQFHQSDSPLRQGSYRGLAATANHHAREMHMDAIARALGVDAVEFRLTHLEDSRLRDVLVKAAETIGWPRASQPGRSLGIACGVEKGAYVATAVEASRTPDGFRLERVVGVFECGAIVNPDGLSNQVEGSIVQGLGGALFEAVRFADGRILNGTLAQYRVPRFKDVPPIEVVLLDRKDLPSAGAGETAIVAIAPAIGSAARAFGEVDTALPVTLTARS